MRGWAAVAAAAGLMLAAGSAEAAVGRWTSGYGQGLSEAMVESASGAELRVACGPGNPFAGAGVSLALPRLRGAGGGDAVPTTFRAGGRQLTLVLQRRVYDAEQVVLSFDARRRGAGRQLASLVRLLGSGGRAVQVTIPGQGVRESFSLSGARRELRGCPGS